MSRLTTLSPRGLSRVSGDGPGMLSLIGGGNCPMNLWLELRTNNRLGRPARPARLRVGAPCSSWSHGMPPRGASLGLEALA